MKPIITVMTVASGKETAIYAAQRIVITLLDEGAGPYLAIQGIDDELTDNGMNEHCFYLESVEEIDQFAAICKGMLYEAKK